MTGYERVKKGKFYYILTANYLSEVTEKGDEADERFYKTANYYSDETVAKNNARADKLMRQLRRYAVEHNEGEIDWKDVAQAKWYILCDGNTGELSITYAYTVRQFGQIYFSTPEIASRALWEFESELLWYFTEYTDHIVEDNKKVELECELCENPEKLQAMQTLGFEYCPMCGEEL